MAERRILVVDDDELMLGVIEHSLRSQGYEVETATNAMEALRAIHETTQPDLVITDVAMLRRDEGLDLIQRLRRNRRTAHLPIIALSSLRRSHEILAGYTVGADEYVTKPVEIPVLIAKVEAILRRARPAVDQEAESHRGHVVLFMHGKGGVGATSLAINTAVALLLGGSYPVALLDLDLAFGNIPLMLNLVPRYTLADLSETSVAEADETTLRQLVKEHESNVWVIAGSSGPERAELVTPTLVVEATERLRTRAEFIVIDTEATFSEVNLAAVDVADLIVVVGAPLLPALKATADCLGVLRKLGVPDRRVLLALNRTTPRGLDAKQLALFQERIQRAADLTVPYAPQCDEAANAGRPFITAFPTNPASREMGEFARHVMTLAAAAERPGSEDEG